MSRLIIGFIPLLDCAPLVAASERGFAARVFDPSDLVSWLGR
jgi:ABC-type nitrate/sulfonate/bicarbonate transport system substrate-binding protein